MVKSTDKTSSEDVKSQEVQHKTSNHSLKEKDNNLKSENEKQTTLLWKAIEDGDDEKAKHLIGEGVSLNETDRHGNTLLHLALALGRYELAQHMVQYLSDCNRTNDEGVAPIHIIAECGKQMKLGRKLIAQGAKVNVADKLGRTPLMLACKRGYFPMASLLLKYGSDLHAKDINGWKAADYASIMGYTHIVNMIKQHVKKEATVPDEIESEESSTDEESQSLSYTAQGQKIYSDHRTIPIKIRKKPLSSASLKKLAIKEERKSVILDEMGNLLPVPEVVKILQTSANKLINVDEWVQQQQNIAEERGKKCKELQEGVNMLLQERGALLRDKEYFTNELKNLVKDLEDGPGKKEGELTNHQMLVLKEGMDELQAEHKTIVKELEELNNQLEEEYENQRIIASNHEAKLEDITNNKNSMNDRLKLLQKRFHELTEDLDAKCKKADESEEHLKVLLRALYSLLIENQNETMHLLERVENQKTITNNATKGSFTTIREENVKITKNMDQITNQMHSVKKHLVKIQQQLENHPLVKRLVEAGVMDEQGNKVTRVSTSHSESRFLKFRRKKQETKPSEEEELDPTGMVILPASEPTACYSTVEAARYSWMDSTQEKASKRLSIISESAESPEIPSLDQITASSTSVNKDTVDDEQTSGLQAKLANIITKHKH